MLQKKNVLPGNIRYTAETSHFLASLLQNSNLGFNYHTSSYVARERAPLRTPTSDHDQIMPRIFPMMKNTLESFIFSPGLIFASYECPDP